MRLLLLLLFPLALLGQTRSVINTGATANDGTGDSARTAFNKANTNFLTLWDGVFTNKVNTLADVLTVTVAAGKTVQTLGYHVAGDGGHGLYRWTNSLPSGASTNRGTWFAGTTGFWGLVYGASVSSAQFGIVPATNNSTMGEQLREWVDWCSSNSVTAMLASGEHRILNTNGVFIRSNMVLDAEPGGAITRGYPDPFTGLQNPRFSPIRVESQGIPFGGSVPIVVTNVTIRNLSTWTHGAEEGGDIQTDTGTNVGNNIAVIGASGVRLENLNIGLHTEAWGLIIASDNVQISGIKIRNAGKRYRDGIHVIGGTNGIISDFDIHAGDDCIAYGSFGAHIGRWTAVGGAVYSTIGNVVDFIHEYESNTNVLDTFVVSDIVYRVGVFRNTALASFNKSTNLTYGFRDISISNIRGSTGETNQIPGFGIENGIHMTGVENLTISDFHIGLSLRRNLYFGTNKNVALVNCTARGTLMTNLQETIYVDTCDRFLISGGSYYTNPTNTGATTARFNSTGSVILNNVFFENLNGSQAVVTGDGVGNFQIANSIINSTGTAFAFLVNPTNVIISGNTLTTAITPATWEGGSPPTSAQIVGNIGMPSIGTSQAIQFQVVSTGGNFVSSIDSPGNIRMRLVNTNSQFMFGADNGQTNNILLRIGSQPKTPANRPLMMLSPNDSGSSPWLGVGYGSVLMDGPRWVGIGAASSDYAEGAERMRVSSAGVRIEPGGVTAQPDASAALEISSTTKGFLPPRMTSAERDLISSPVDGLQIYNTTTSKGQIRAGGSWVDLH